MLVVLDTNILVSALKSKHGAPAKLVYLVLSNYLTPCFDYRILNEYREVLTRPKFSFSKSDVNALLDWIIHYGLFVMANPITEPFTDESDKKFFEVAMTCGADLITGNLKHFPNNPHVLGVNEFLQKLT